MKISNFSKISTNIFGSRVTGFIRDILFANYLGANLMSDAFLFAYRLPNLFRRIFAEGSMNSVFIPLYVNQEKMNSKSANDFIWIVFNFFFVITLFLSFLIFFFTEQVISILAPGFLLNKSQFLLANQLLIITFPFLIFVTLSSVLSSVLNVKGKFFLPSFLSVILNIFMIVTLVSFKSNSHFALAWSMIIAGFTQLILLFINLGTIKIFWGIGLKSIKVLSRELKKFFGRFLYSLLGSGIVQLNIFISMLFASLVGGGAISQIYYADRIIDLPFALIAVAMSFTLLPYLSKNISDESKNSKAFNETVIFCFLFAIPSAFGIFILSEDIIRALFGRGEFNNEDVLITSKILLVYSFSLPGYMLARIFNQVFYSYEKVEYPVKAAVPTFICNFILCFLLYRPLGVLGLAISGAVSIWLNLFIQIFYLRKNFRSFYEKLLIFDFIKLLKILISAIIMVISILIFKKILDLNIYVDLFIQILIGLIIYFLILNWLKLNEIKLVFQLNKFN
ncbi:MAG: putative lipid II flippase MurJ [Pelagibacteraceae bacterium]|nr:MAG: putative lipid II flippase MurJ [Pelagibacteraceae bacterium]